MLKAIETVYKGYKFRSRLEARWAVFFDALDIEYEYEKEGFELEGFGRYLPDFYLPVERLWVEIKGQEPTEQEMKKARLLADQGHTNVLILAGTLSAPEYRRLSFPGETVLPDYIKSTYNGTLFVGHLYHATQICDDYQLDPHRFESLCEGHLKEHYHRHPEWFSSPIPDFDVGLDIYKKLIELDKQYYLAQYKKPHPRWYDGLTANNLLWSGSQTERFGRVDFTPMLSDFFKNGDIYDSQINKLSLLQEAYRIAQQARFEYGETPVVR